jgi:hypothetical protein
MSGETEESVSGWTVDTLHTHLMRQIELLRGEMAAHVQAEIRAQDLAFQARETATKAALASAEKAVEAALAAQKEAVAVAQTVAEKRADIQNEWRSSLNDVLMRAMPRQEAESVIARATERIQELVTAQQHMVTRQEADLATKSIDKRIGALEKAAANLAGRLAVVGAIVTFVLSLVIVAANATLR